ncbi:MAG: (2Fe-2S)-binding protein [Calditrichaeota bacterium]|nr:(2Fe-2S)-binding protein [Calditrichota bacterium]
MKKKSVSSSLSRRQFLKGFGSGVAGSVALNKIASALPLQKTLEKAANDANRTPLNLSVNGKTYRLSVEPNRTLAEVIREDLQLTGTKVVCNHGECGACTVLLDGEAVYSCHILALDAEGKSVTTIEGLLGGEELHPLQKAFVKKDGIQCGFCTPGQIMAAQALLLKNPRPAKEDVLEGMSGNLCRCGAYPKIIESVLEAAKTD